MADNALDSVLSIDVSTLTIEEVEIIEDTVDMPFDEAFKPGHKKARLMRALAYIAQRRTNPNVTLEEVGALRIAVTKTEESPTNASA